MAENKIFAHTPEEVEALINKEGIEYVSVRFTDLIGVQQCRHAQGAGLSYGQPHLFLYDAVGEGRAAVTGVPNCCDSRRGRSDGRLYYGSGRKDKEDKQYEFL